MSKVTIKNKNNGKQVYRKIKNFFFKTSRITLKDNSLLNCVKSKSFRILTLNTTISIYEKRINFSF